MQNLWALLSRPPPFSGSSYQWALGQFIYVVGLVGAQHVESCSGLFAVPTTRCIVTCISEAIPSWNASSHVFLLSCVLELGLDYENER